MVLCASFGRLVYLGDFDGFVVCQGVFREEGVLQSFVSAATHESITEHVTKGISELAVLGQLA